MLIAQKDHVPRVGAHFLSLAAALLDWFEVGTSNGNRLGEWAQPSGRAHLGDHQLNIFGETQAFTLPDVRGQLKSKVRVPGVLILAHILVAYVCMWLRWRTQKNGDNEQERMWATNPNPNGRSLTRPLYNIIKRFVHLRGSADSITPLGIYQHSDGSIRHITDRDIELSMRALAATVYKLCPIKDKKALQLWSSHSLRVGACVILHSMGFTGPQIQYILRWRSNAFMTYLRNCLILAQKQNAALDEAGPMPQI